VLRPLPPPPPPHTFFFSCPFSRPCLRLSRVKTKPNNPINHIKRNRKGKKPTRERKRETRTISPFSPFLTRSMPTSKRPSRRPRWPTARASRRRTLSRRPRRRSRPVLRCRCGPTRRPVREDFFLGGVEEKKRRRRKRACEKKKKRRREKKRDRGRASKKNKRENSLFFSSLSYLLDKLFQEEPRGDRATVAPPGVLHVGDLRVFFSSRADFSGFF